MATATTIAASSGTPKGIDTANLNPAVRPADDFYAFACGGWQASHPLPAAYSRYATFDQLGESNARRVSAILKDLTTSEFAAGSTEQKLSTLYRQATDSTRRDRDGLAPLMAVINRMEQAATRDELFAVQLSLAPYGDTEFFDLGYGADDKQATQNITFAWQGGITLGQKSYYLDTDSATAAIREAYTRHIVRMFRLLGFTAEAAEAKQRNILDIETRLARASRTPAELRDPERNYNKMSRADFNARYPHLALDKQLPAMGIALQYADDIVVGQPEFLAAADSVVAELTPAAYRDYMEWGQVCTAAGYLTSDFVEAQFDFFGRTLTGSKQNKPLWQRATAQVEGVMGQALGKMYVDKYFPASSKDRMLRLVGNLQTALGQRIAEQDWMTDTTKAMAQEKLAAFTVKIGYPDKWDDYSGMNVDASRSYYENIMECRRFRLAYSLGKKLGKPVDRTEWHMTPQTANAYYNPTTNEICFPAGILQPPFFDAEADDAFNYGAIGVVIGHEMTHGFDDQGRNYDKEGNLHDWWTVSDAKRFNAKADQYADFFSAIKVLPDLNANGRFTLGENLADHGGLQVAFAAYRNATAGAHEPVRDGYTAEQRFFIAYAGVWAGNITDEEIRRRTKVDPHSLGEWRVNGALPHIDAWYEAFHVAPTDKMYLSQDTRLKLW